MSLLTNATYSLLDLFSKPSKDQIRGLNGEVFLFFCVFTLYKRLISPNLIVIFNSYVIIIQMYIICFVIKVLLSSWEKFFSCKMLIFILFNMFM